MTRPASRPIAAALALLLGASAVALAQQAPPAVAPPASTAGPLVTAATASHVATLTGAPGAAGTALVIVDDQNNALKWTIEYTGIVATGAVINCDAAAPAAGAPPAAAGAAPNGVDLAGTDPADRNLASPMNGETAGLDATIFGLIATGACTVVIAADGNDMALTGALALSAAATAAPAPTVTPAP